MIGINEKARDQVPNGKMKQLGNEVSGENWVLGGCVGHLGRSLTLPLPTPYLQLVI